MVKMQAQKIVMGPAAKLSSLNTKVAPAERKVEELEKELDGSVGEGRAGQALLDGGCEGA